MSWIGLPECLSWLLYLDAWVEQVPTNHCSGPWPPNSVCLLAERGQYSIVAIGRLHPRSGCTGLQAMRACAFYSLCKTKPSFWHLWSYQASGTGLVPELAFSSLPRLTGEVSWAPCPWLFWVTRSGPWKDQVWHIRFQWQICPCDIGCLCWIVSWYVIGVFLCYEGFLDSLVIRVLFRLKL